MGSLDSLSQSHTHDLLASPDVPDLVVTDLQMPNRDGFAVIEALQPLIAAPGSRSKC